MYRIAFVLSGLAYFGRCRQALSSVGQLDSIPLSYPSNTLVALLLEFIPAAAFSPSGPGCISASSQRGVVGARGRLGHIPVMKRKLKVKNWAGSMYLPTTTINARRQLAPEVQLKQGKTARICDIQGLHITAGEFRNRRLTTPDVHLRPMMSRVREALFNMLQPANIFREGNSALDLFAGSGAVGLESLSRGMGNATFVDFSPRCVETIHDNLEKCRVEDRGHVVEASVEDFLLEPARFGITKPFSLVTVTPPYEEVVYADLVNLVAHSPAVGDDTIVVIEYPIELGCFPPIIVNSSLVGVRNRRYGRTVIAIYINRPSHEILENLPAAQSEFMGA